MAEPILASHPYPVVLYNATRLETTYPCPATVPQYVEIKAENVSASGARETMRFRSEEQRQLGIFLEGGFAVEEWRNFSTRWGQRGEQFELMTDRNMGALLTFQNTAVDVANGNVVTFAGVSAYARVGGKLGIVLANSAAVCLQNPAGSLAAPVVQSGGTIVMTFVPKNSMNTTSIEVVFDVASTNAAAGNRVICYKTATQPYQLAAEVWTSGGSKSIAYWDAASWAADQDVIGTIVTFTSAGSVGLWFSRNGVTQVATNVAAQQGSFTTMPGTATLHAQCDDTLHMPMTLLHAGFYRYPFQDPTVLGSYFPYGRNYYDKAELLDQGFAPSRLAPTVDLWQLTLNVRQGV